MAPGANGPAVPGSRVILAVAVAVAVPFALSRMTNLENSAPAYGEPVAKAEKNRKRANYLTR